MLQKYLITSREFYTDTPAVFRKIFHEQCCQHLPDYALYRDKSNPNYASMAEHFVEVCAGFESLKAILHSDVDLALKLNAYGVHLPSHEQSKIEYAKRLGLQVIVSTHSYEEICRAQELGADYVTYSPIFPTPNKGKAKGVEELDQVVQKCRLKIFALGGIVSEKEVEQISKTTAYGFASIRYFY